WRVTSNGWHYALGRPGDKTTDGWVGFGGRRGQHWLRFRLARVGYFDNPAQNSDLGANFYDIGGAPNYNRANLSQLTHTQVIEGIEYKYRSSVRWGNVWNTPGAGRLFIQWRSDGARLKEDVVINQAGREWIAANRSPAFFGLPNAGTYFGFVFQIDWSDIPKRVINGVLRGSDDGFSDDAGGIELRTALDELIAFLPIDYAYVDTGKLVKPQVRLRKRFWKDADGNHYMAVGAPVTELNALPAGDLIFDPTINTDIQASADDGV